MSVDVSSSKVRLAALSSSKRGDMVVLGQSEGETTVLQSKWRRQYSPPVRAETILSSNLSEGDNTDFQSQQGRQHWLSVRLRVVMFVFQKITNGCVILQSNKGGYTFQQSDWGWPCCPPFKVRGTVLHRDIYDKFAKRPLGLSKQASVSSTEKWRLQSLMTILELRL